MVALHEPLPPEMFDSIGKTDALKSITQFAYSAQQEVLSDRSLPSKQIDGSVPSNPVESDVRELRAEKVSLGRLTIDKMLANDFMLVIKHNALFTALLDKLTEQFRCFAIIRNPLATLASWQTVNLPVQSGRVPMGERFDQKLKSQLDALPDTIDRQLVILRWFYQRLTTSLDKEQIIRYEDIIQTQGQVLSKLTGQDLGIAGELEDQNMNHLYKDLAIDELCDHLESQNDIYENFYHPSELKTLADNIQSL